MKKKTSSLPINNVALWASAFVLGGLILTQAGRIQTAQADSVSTSNGFCMSTITCGNQTGSDTYDLLWLVDDRSETLMIFYGDVYNKVLDLRTTKNLADIFKQARGN
ncbi:MAG: hypothetical protein K8R92_07335 [Planctomycetes bacterium]|nr:hypothetical protein [Planctomycetota bacterium]